MLLDVAAGTVAFLKPHPELLVFVAPSGLYLFLRRFTDVPLVLRTYVKATLLGGLYSTLLIVVGTAGLALIALPYVVFFTLLPSAAVGVIYGFPLVLLLKSLKTGARRLCLVLGPLPGLALLAYTNIEAWIGLLAMFNGGLVMFAAMNGIRDLQAQPPHPSDVCSPHE